VIRFHNVSKSYDDGDARPALRSISFEIADGEFVALIGPSGSGKSTALALLNRLIEPSAGIIEIEGQEICGVAAPALRRRIGFVFQGIGLFPHLAVSENVGITPRLLGWRGEDIQSRVSELLQLVRLPLSYATRMPAELSGGEQQRVGVARALAARPKIMLMDEPFGALDPLVRDDLTADYRTIHDRLGLTTVLVTHDMTEALLMADKIIVLRDGEIVQGGTPQTLMRAPADDFVRTLIETPRRRADRLTDILREATS
jgi:osmoprotectant transport system ATP-binding protein